MKKITDKFLEYDELRDQLWDLCDNYATANNITLNDGSEHISFHDFTVIDRELNGKEYKEVALFFVDEYGEHCCAYHGVTFEELEKFDKEITSLNWVVTNLLTGRYLLKGPENDKDDVDMMNEFCHTLEKINNNEKLNDREKYLIRLGGAQFYEGLEDMCEQLNVNYENLIYLL